MISLFNFVNSWNDIGHLLWTVLNLAFSLSVLYYFFKILSFIYRELGIWQVVFIIFCISCLKGWDTKKTVNLNTFLIKNGQSFFLNLDQKNQQPTEGYKGSLVLNLETKGSLKYDILLAVFERNGEIEILNKGVFPIGLTSGKEIYVNNLSIQKLKDPNKYNYNVNVFVIWKLMSVTVFTQYKQFSGQAEIGK
jgi:hypothetical protein